MKTIIDLEHRLKRSICLCRVGSNQRGGISMLMALVAAGVVTAAALSVSKWSTNIIVQHKYDDPSKIANFIKQNVINTLNAPGAWEQTVVNNPALSCVAQGLSASATGQASSGNANSNSLLSQLLVSQGQTGSVTKITGSLNKLAIAASSLLGGTASQSRAAITAAANSSPTTSGTQCSFGGAYLPIDLYDSQGNLVLPSTDQTIGFDMNGNLCTGFSLTSGNDACPMQYVVKTTVDCSVKYNGQCSTIFTGALQYSPASKEQTNLFVHSLNIANYSFSFRLGAMEGTVGSGCAAMGGSYDANSSKCDLSHVTQTTPKTSITAEQLETMCPGAKAKIDAAIAGGQTTPLVLSQCELGSNLARSCPPGKVFAGTESSGRLECRDLPASQDCSLKGTTIANGASATFYRRSSVEFGKSCSPEVRVCNNGVLSGSFENSTCNVSAAKGCDDDGDDDHDGSSDHHNDGDSVVYYRTARPGDDDGTGYVPATCESITRTCHNGVKDGDDHYRFKSCNPALASSCDFKGKKLLDGVSTTGYATATVPYGQTCVSGAVTCNNGVLSGNASFPYASCEVVGRSCKMPVTGKTVNHGDDGDFYRQAVADPGSTCSPVTVARTCVDGTFTGDASATYESCAQSAGQCNLGGKAYQNNAVVIGYKSSQVASTATCADAGNSLSMTCVNGVWTDMVGGLSTASYKYSRCSPSTPHECEFSTLDGKHVEMMSGGSTVLYPSGSSTTCLADAVTVSCNNGTTSPTGSSYYSTCK